MGATFKFELDISDVLKNIQAYSDRISKGFKPVFANLADIHFVQNMKRKIKSNNSIRSGELLKSIRYKPVSVRKNYIDAIISDFTNHGIYVEKGTLMVAPIRPKNGSSLIFFSRGNKWVLPQVKGQAPQPFFQNTIHENMDKFKQDLANRIKEGMA